jgi:hypothetical protein
MQLFTCAGTEVATLKKDWDVYGDMYRDMYRDGVLNEKAVPVGVEVADAAGVAAKQVRRVLTSAIGLPLYRLRHALVPCATRLYRLRHAVLFTPATCIVYAGLF